MKMFIRHLEEIATESGFSLTKGIGYSFQLTINASRIYLNDYVIIVFFNFARRLSKNERGIATIKG